MAQGTFEKVSIVALLIIFIMFAVIVIFAKYPYASKESIEFLIVPYLSLATFAFFILLFFLSKGTEQHPAGKKKFAQLIQRKQYSSLVKSILAVPLLSIATGYFVFGVVATAPALPTKYLINEIKESKVMCVKTGRGKFRGRWSLFHFEDGEEIKVSGFGQICPKTVKSCLINYKEGFLGYYVENVKC